ncbi:hypothetical protein GPJ56_010440 [Histomonas meleagridis]|uniref:uncharacterized protein n=1 Tax=Histomonas meleagridis TaxID=135588 RepID=UPI003559F249|nr:hypothetical protein GPJ56_010440 [Histomonas meleagridis]KAH0799001.1 hypothetical protein GO595_008153 [Histomonas meleagridis]
MTFNKFTAMYYQGEYSSNLFVGYDFETVSQSTAPLALYSIQTGDQTQLQITASTDGFYVPSIGSTQGRAFQDGKSLLINPYISAAKNIDISLGENVSEPQNLVLYFDDPIYAPIGYLSASALSYFTTIKSKIENFAIHINFVGESWQNVQNFELKLCIGDGFRDLIDTSSVPSNIKIVFEEPKCYSIFTRIT